MTQLLVDPFSPSEFQTRVLLPKDAETDDINDFEKELLTEFAASRDREFAEQAAFLGGAYVFYKAVRLDRKCAACHVGMPGDLLGIVKVELSE